MKIRILVFAAALVCAFAQLNAANYYMSPGGSDSDTGASPTHAWASLQHGTDILMAGDTLFVMGGTYGTAQYWVNGNGGTVLRPIVIKAYGDAVAYFPTPGVLNGSEPGYFLWYGSGNAGHFVVDGESHLNPGPTRYFTFTGACYRQYRVEPDLGHYRNGMILRGCEFDGTLGGINTGTTVVTITYADSFVIDNCYMHHAWHPTGDISPGDGTDRECSAGEPLVIRSCEYGKVTNNTLRYGNHGLALIQRVRIIGSHPSRYITVSGNTFDNGWGGGLYLTFESEYCLVENNVFYHCGVATTYPKPCIQLGGVHNTIRKNVFYNPNNQELQIQAGREIEGETWNTICQHNYIYNNTFFMAHAYPLQIFVSNEGGSPWATASADHNVIANNIFYKTTRTTCDEDGSHCKKILLRVELYWANDANNWITPDVHGTSPSTTLWGNNKFSNNLLRKDARGASADSMVLYTEDGNYGGGAYMYPIATLQNDGSGAWANNIGGDPRLASESPDSYGAGWWYLQSGSACIDAGIAVIDSNGIWMRANGLGYSWSNLSYSGSAPDIGAYEVNGENPTPPMAPVLSGSPTRVR